MSPGYVVEDFLTLKDAEPGPEGPSGSVVYYDFGLSPPSLSAALLEAAEAFAAGPQAANLTADAFPSESAPIPNSPASPASDALRAFDPGLLAYLSQAMLFDGGESGRLRGIVSGGFLRGFVKIALEGQGWASRYEVNRENDDEGVYFLERPGFPKLALVFRGLAVFETVGVSGDEGSSSGESFAAFAWRIHRWALAQEAARDSGHLRFDGRSGNSDLARIRLGPGNRGPLKGLAASLSLTKVGGERPYLVRASFGSGGGDTRGLRLLLRTAVFALGNRLGGDLVSGVKVVEDGGRVLLDGLALSEAQLTDLLGDIAFLKGLAGLP